MGRPTIVVVGSANTDLVVRVPSLPKPGQTLLGEDFQVIAGGKGANQAVACARLGAQVVFVGSVGDDEFGHQTLQNLQQEGIGTDYITRAEGVPSGVALIAVAESGENMIVVAPGANARLSRDHVRRAEPAFAQADAVIAQLEVPIEAVLEAANLAQRYQRPFVLNPAPAQSLPPELTLRTTWLIPNESEAQILTGQPSTTSPEQQVQALQAQGWQRGVLTLGANGVLCWHEGELVYQPAYAVSVVDTTSAGDAFVAGFTLALVEGRALPDALAFAQAVSALSVMRWGAQPSLPTRREVEEAQSHLRYNIPDGNAPALG
ncbi:MAG: ribokinase [Fimbriimonadales bacterium]